ncbi:hypothetical protein F5Y03DRAFT_35973 [Xylaria venustula]|nr:hypothetical protein F5Y03DRAFT_35973 [Xylaria venustula]
MEKRRGNRSLYLFSLAQLSLLDFICSYHYLGFKGSANAKGPRIQMGQKLQHLRAHHHRLAHITVEYDFLRYSEALGNTYEEVRGNKISYNGGLTLA